MNKAPLEASTNLQNKDRERARLKHIALKWARISMEKAKENATLQNGRHYNGPTMGGA